MVQAGIPMRPENLDLHVFLMTTIFSHRSRNHHRRPGNQRGRCFVDLPALYSQGLEKAAEKLGEEAVGNPDCCARP